jgi:hypothetical protein
MPQLWYRFLLRTITLVYYRRLRVVCLAALSIGKRPTLLVGLHRNGAVDGMLYKRVFPRSVFVIARQLIRSWFAKVFFTGIPVARSQDAADATSRRANPESLARAVDHLVSGGHLFVLPEGTSDLGPRHLPFKPGAARILAATIDRGVTPLVIPVGIFYDAPATFRSDVCVVVGKPIDVSLSLEQAADSRTRIDALMARITAGLEAIAVEAVDVAALRRIEAMAAIADEQMGETRWRVQRMLTNSPLPPDVGERWDRITHDISSRRIAVDRAGVPRFSRRGIVWNAVWAAIQSIVVAVAWLINILPLAGAWLAGRRLADAPNTITLWRILVGTPLTAVWWTAVAALAFATRNVWIVPSYAVITLLGLVAYPEWCVRRPMLKNARAPHRLRDDVCRIAEWSRHVAA